MNYKLQKKIFWLVPSLNINQASVRLRCFHIARELEKTFDYENLFFSDVKDIKRSIEPEAFLFIIKVPNEIMLSLLVKAKALNCKIIIDITDTVCDIHYKNNDYGFNNWILNSLIDLVSAIFVPTSKMRSHLLEHANSSNKHSWDRKILIIPDIAETHKDAINVCEYLVDKFEDKIASEALKQFSSTQSDTNEQIQIKRVLWFGNAYSPTSNMGISSLIPLLPTIKKLQERQHFILAICTNANAELSTIKAFGIQYEIIEWSLAEIFRQLSLAKVTLITTGDDKRCEGKSNNRVLSSLINNCPAIVIRHPNNSEFDTTIDTSLKSGISRFIFSKNSESERNKALDSAEPILNRYMINEIVKLYSLTLQNIDLELLAAHEQYEGLKENENSIIMICDDLPIKELDKTCSLLKKEIPSCRVSYIQFAPPSDETINYFSSNQIMPYLLRIDELEKSHNFLNGNVCIVIADNLNPPLYNKLLEYVNSANRFAASSKANITLVKQSKLKAFLKESNISREPIDFDNSIRVPENIPGRYQPSDITSKDLDILFICGIEAKNWILDGIAKEIGSRSKKSWAIYYCDKQPKNLPKANNYFFMHQALLMRFAKLKLIDLSTSGNINCWYTHPRDENDKSIAQFLDIFGSINKVIFACSENYNLWISRGLDPNHGCVVLGGYDSSLFVPHNRELCDTIGICSSFYERKNPELLFQLVSKMTDKKFILLGKNWESYARYEALIGLGNLQYVTVQYENYPTYYNKFKVFLSTSRIEGGPIPLIEAMACNCFPVVSKTGFASDIIKHGSNGFLFDTSSSAKIVSDLIEIAYTMNDVDIASSVSNYSWGHFSKRIFEAIEK